MPDSCLSLDKKNPGFDAAFETHRFSEELKKIEAITKKLKIKHLFEFFSMAAQNSLCPPEYQEKVVPWFDAQEGIDWLEAVIGYIRDKPSSVKEPKELLADLTQCRDVLRKAKKIGAKWHFWMDI
jgi:hypothetical protein